MKKDSYELLDDGFINLYEEGIFIRCFEYSALEISRLFDYKIFPNIDKKTGKIYIEVGFPKSKKQDIFSVLDKTNYNYRFTSKSSGMTQTFGTHKIQKDEEYLLKLKKDLITFK